MVIISSGEIVADGTPESLRNQLEGQEILHLELKGDGMDTNDAFSVIDGVEKVNTVSGNGGGSTAYDISISGHRDIREEIFNKSVENGWTILEMHLNKSNLEDVFRNLTKSQGG